MKNYKKLFCMFLSVVMVLGLFAGCNKDKSDETVAPTEPVVTVAPTEMPTEPPTEPATEPTEIAEYAITYELNGGYLNDGSARTYTAESNVALPEPAKDGYAFAGWYEEEDFSGEEVASTEGLIGDKIFYAKWEEVSEAPSGSDQNDEKHIHSYTSAVTKPTYTAKGYTTYTCSCGHSYKDNYTDKLSAAPVHQHSYNSTVTKPTCSANGYTTHTCACGHSYKDSEVPAPGHNYKASVVAPTTSSQGYTLHTCTVCGDSYKDNYTDKLPVVTEPPATEPPATEPPATEPPATEPPATEPPTTEPPTTEPPATEPPATEPPATEPPATEPPATEPPATEPVHQHSYGSAVTAPTCTTGGYTTYTCACGHSYKDSEVPPHGHSWVEDMLQRYCEICGHYERK